VPRLFRGRTTLFIYALLGVWGYVLYGFGPVVGLLRDEQHTSRGVASLHSTAFALGALIGGATTPWLVRRYGRPATMWAGVFGTVGVIGAMCLVRPLPLTLLASVFFGLIGTFLLSGIVSSLSDTHGDAAPAAISEANAVACAVGAVAPVAIGAAVGAHLGWRPGFLVGGALFVILAVAGLALRVRFPTVRAVPVSVGTTTGQLPRAYWLAFLVMCMCGSVEVSVNLWSADLLRVRAGMAPGEAAAAVSAVVGGMFLGRALGARLALRYAPTTVFLGALAVSLTGFALFWVSTSPALGVAGLIVLGLGNALHYPLAISIALVAATGQPDLAASRSAYAMAFSFGLAPFLLGGLADVAGVRWAFLLVPAMLAVAGMVVLRLRRSALTVPPEPALAVP
jgi:MFS family permease